MDYQVKMLTPFQVAGRLGITTKRVYALIDAGKLDAIDVSIGEQRPRWRIAENEIEQFLRRMKKQRPLASASVH